MAENVRATLAFVARGETPIGIVYETDAKVEPKVKDRRRVSGRLASAGHLSGGGDRRRDEAERVAHYLQFPAHAGRQGDLRKIRLQLSDQAGVVGGTTRVRTLAPGLDRVALSLRIAVVATLVALPFGIAIATLLARKSFWGKSLLDAVVHLPLVLPPVVTGYLLLITFGRKAPVGAFLADHFGIVFSFRWTGAALACGIMAFPLMVRADPAVDRGDRPAAGRRRRDARRQPVWLSSP